MLETIHRVQPDGRKNLPPMDLRRSRQSVALTCNRACSDWRRRVSPTVPDAGENGSHVRIVEPPVEGRHRTDDFHDSKKLPAITRCRMTSDIANPNCES
jgi:hypothetical protein